MNAIDGEGVDEEMVFVWANAHGEGGMLPPEYWEALGYRRVRRHQFWPASWLMELQKEAVR